MQMLPALPLFATPMRLSVIICTHNRPDALERCVTALMAGSHEDGCEFLVIDSASDTQARHAMEMALSGYPSIALHRLEVPGLSHARNTGIAHASGEWVAFLDDDTVPAPDWLTRACELIAAVPPDCAIIGGAVYPLHEGAMPTLPTRWLQLLSIIEDDGEGDRTDNPSVCGANIILRKSLLLQVGGFPESLGRKGLRLLSGEEKFVERRLIANGARLWYSDRLRVQHVIEAERLEWPWIRDRAYWEGISDVVIMRLLGAEPGLPRLIKVACGAAALGLVYALFRRRDERTLRFWYDVGWLREFFTRRQTRTLQEQ